MNKQLLKAFVTIALALIMCFGFQAMAFAETIEFENRPIRDGDKSGGTGEVAPRGFGVKINGEFTWLQSEYNNTGFLAIHTGEVNGTSSVPLKNDDGTDIEFFAYIDKNPTPAPRDCIVAVYKNGVRLPANAYSVGAPARDDLSTDPSGSTGRFRVPITGLKLEPGCNYEFAFLRGITSNNGMTCVISADGTGYLRNPSTAVEQALYDAQKYTEYEYREYQQIYNLPDINTYRDNRAYAAGTQTYRPMRFRFTTSGTPVVSVTGVKLNNTKLTLNSGKSAALKAMVSPGDATNTNVTWKSGSSKVATVSSKGVVTAKGAGKATITVTTADGKYTAKCVVTVNVPAVKVTLDKTKASIVKGKSIRLTAKVTPSNVSPSKITWTTSDAKVATVSSSGLVKGIKAGKATITAKAWNGKYTRCVVTVK